MPLSDEDCRKCMHDYELAGLPGALASTDCIHITWDAASTNIKQFCANGKYGGARKTMVYQVSCNHRKEILYTTSTFTEARTISDPAESPRGGGKSIFKVITGPICAWACLATDRSITTFTVCICIDTQDSETKLKS